jgi:hypothetical protein
MSIPGSWLDKREVVALTELGTRETNTGLRETVIKTDSTKTT